MATSAVEQTYWIALAHLRPIKSRHRSGAKFSGMYQYIGGPARSRSEFERDISAAAEQQDFVLIEITEMDSLDDYRVESRISEELKDFVEELEAVGSLTSGPGWVYEGDD